MTECSRGPAISLVHHQLQAVTVRVAEIDAAVLPRAAGNGDAVFLQFSPERIIRPCGDVESVAGRQRGITDFLEQRHALTAGVQKHLPLVLQVRCHTKDLGVEVLRALHVTDMQYDMVDPGRLNHRFLLLLARVEKEWCPESDSNQRPTAYEAVALPLSYRGEPSGCF